MQSSVCAIYVVLFFGEKQHDVNSCLYSNVRGGGTA